jgi:hypothetical protein
MALSPNYGWTEPDNTGLVKNGAQDMRTLGDAIDTSVWNVGFGQAGKNKIINGDFGIWQRGTSGFSLGAAFNADRWAFYRDGSGATEAVTRQTFTPGAAPVAGYESQFFWRYAATVAGTGGTERSLYTKIEDVRTFAGQTVTLSFWAKADAARTITLSLKQNFGSGGSTEVTTSLTSQSATTSWARYSVSVALPSISGKTIGTSSFLQLTMSFPVNVVETIDIWGVQLERGSKATPFQTASGGSPQAELAMCQRYYFRATGSPSGFPIYGVGQCSSTASAFISVNFPVTMRTAPTSLEQSGVPADYALTNSVFSVLSCNAVPSFLSASVRMGTFNALVASGLVGGNATMLASNASSNGFLGWSAEL